MSRPHTPAYQIRRQGLNNASSLNLTSAAGSHASSRAATPLGKAVISLEEWESRSPLSDEQLQSISVVKEKFGERSLPEKFTKAESSAQAQAAASSRPSTPARSRPLPSHLHSPTRSPSTPNTPTGQFSSHLAIPDPLYPTSITTPQQFLDHFTALTLSTEHEQDSLYRDHLAEIIGLREKCDALIELLLSGEGEVKEMLKCLAYVEERSESLRGACEDLLEEQTHLLTHTSQLAHRLTFFTFLETAQRMLNNPGNNLVLSPDFLPMVKRLDECLSYLGEHRDFKDAELYLIRYQQCMTRSMTLIKFYFVGALKALGQEVGRRIGDKGLSETATQALIYTKFVSLSQPLRPLLAELEQRVSSNPDELTTLLTECHNAWVGTRQSLMGTGVNEEIMRMNPTGSDLVDLTRSGCSYLKQTCLDEFNLFKHFFLSGETQLYGFLEGLCDHLYDHIRPRILHEPSLQVLCGVCTVLQALMVQDVSAEDDDPDNAIYSPASTPGQSPFGLPGGDDYFTPRPRLYRSGSTRSHTRSLRRHSSFSSAGMSRQGSFSLSQRTVQRRKSRKPLGRLHIEVLLKMVLQDAQTRLVFRAQALLSADVDYYAAKEGDLGYPEKLDKGVKGRKLIQRQNSVSLDMDDEDEPSFLALPPPEAQESWYPTLRTTLWILSCLYTYVDNAVFEDLAQEAVTTCRRSLSTASDQLGAKKEKKMDGKLFLIRHLLILKEMTAGLALGKNRRREWSGIGDFLKSLLDNATSLLGYQRGSVVKASEFAPDARTDVDRALKIACEELISLVVARSTIPLRLFLDKCTSYLSKSASTNASAGGSKNADLSAQEFATPDKVRDVHEEFKKVVEKEVGIWKDDLRRYLMDEETVGVLVPPALNAIVDSYRQFHDLIRAEYDFTTAAAIMTPSAVLSMLQKVE
ncbi:hypothetical protein CI109_103515 [Kwoniella shandongensis]|uniref:Conserved oligomeric Golgi complex subunit 3 n=1 Tax=Kwoniella shandongensis TaxID=1734106 RepID=A0A5M6BW02_9TREE|nr:uncharacterized protein CI109_004583 [Kwoniella shandongensis]KAA5527048.1 hypothetical protein CI109_004583 [Kwoniella shandongensis]